MNALGLPQSRGSLLGRSVCDVRTGEPNKRTTLVTELNTGLQVKGKAMH